MEEIIKRMEEIKREDISIYNKLCNIIPSFIDGFYDGEHGEKSAKMYRIEDYKI